MSSKVSVCFYVFFFSLSSFLAKNPYPPCEDINGNSREVNLKIEDFMESKISDVYKTLGVLVQVVETLEKIERIQN